MTEIYGHKWVSSYGEEPNGAWCGIVDNLTTEQIKHGLSELLKSPDPWPPTAIQFRQLCTGEDGLEWQRKAHRVDTTMKIEDQSATARRCAEGLEQIRKLREEVGL